MDHPLIYAQQHAQPVEKIHRFFHARPQGFVPDAHTQPEVRGVWAGNFRPLKVGRQRRNCP